MAASDFHVGLRASATALLAVVCALCLSACGGGDDSTPTEDVAYDEAVDGPLPYTLTGLTDAELARVTVALPVGISVVRGASNTGETLVVTIGPEAYLRSITVEYDNQVTRNDHVLFVFPYPFVAAVLSRVTPLAQAGTHRFTVVSPGEVIGPGAYEVYSGTSIIGLLQDSRFSLTFDVRRRGL